MADQLQSEIDRNFDFFSRKVGELMPRYRGMFAVLHSCAIESIQPSAGAAEAEGYTRHPDGLFSIQEITDAPVDLGFYSHAVDLR